MCKVQDCLLQNNALRVLLNRLRLEQSSTIPFSEIGTSGAEVHVEDGGSDNKSASENWPAERTKLKVTSIPTTRKIVMLEESFLTNVFLSLQESRVLEYPKYFLVRFSMSL